VTQLNPAGEYRSAMEIAEHALLMLRRRFSPALRDSVARQLQCAADSYGGDSVGEVFADAAATAKAMS
jgi:hypothetical protein